MSSTAGWTSLGYCAPGAASRTRADRVSLAVTFADDEGRTTTIHATALVTQGLTIKAPGASARDRLAG
jgi:hypothetical protein